MPTKDDTLAWLHQGHAHAVVRDVYRVIDSTSGRICMLVAPMMPAPLSALIGLRELHAAVHGLSWLLSKGISKLLLEIYKKIELAQLNSYLDEKYQKSNQFKPNKIVLRF